MKFSEWNIREQQPAAWAPLEKAGFSPLAARALSARGIADADAARAFLACGASDLHDPLGLPDMDKACARLRRALAQKEIIAVYGDYDVDGMTALSMTADFFRRQGVVCHTYIPDRGEEGYGLNENALRSLREKGVSLVVTVDCGSTALCEAEAARDMGLDLVITDHHACREVLPEACAVVNPRRSDSAYPFAGLSGVGVAFKLLCALSGPDELENLLSRYAEFVCLGTVADVMPLIDENRYLTRRGLAALETTARPGLRHLLRESGLENKAFTAETVSFALCPRLNAAGRLGKTEVAVELLLCDEIARAEKLARTLDELNRQRQQIEGVIFDEAREMAEAEETLPPALVLASDKWHSGVVGIVASRLVSQYGRPVFLICIEKGMGKGSARGVPGLELTAALESASVHLTSHGGHAQAAGFSLPEENIPAFRRAVCDYVAAASGTLAPPALGVDAPVLPELLTLPHVRALAELEPFGEGNARPLFYLEALTLARITPIGGGKHLRLTLTAGDAAFDAVWFGMDAIALGLVEGDRVDAAFYSEINNFRSQETVQLRLRDVRLHGEPRLREAREGAVFDRLLCGEPLSPEEAGALLPGRDEFSAVWRYVNRKTGHAPLTEQVLCLLRSAAREAGIAYAPGRLLVALEVLTEQGLLFRWQSGGEVTLEAAARQGKTDLSAAPMIRTLEQLAAGEHNT